MNPKLCLNEIPNFRKTENNGELRTTTGDPEKERIEPISCFDSRRDLRTLNFGKVRTTERTIPSLVKCAFSTAETLLKYTREFSFSNYIFQGCEVFRLSDLSRAV